MQSLFTVCIRPAIEYASVAWCGIRSVDSQRLERLQSSTARLIAGVSVRDRLPHEILLCPCDVELHVLSLLFVFCILPLRNLLFLLILLLLICLGRLLPFLFKRSSPSVLFLWCSAASAASY